MLLIFLYNSRISYCLADIILMYVFLFVLGPLLYKRNTICSSFYAGNISQNTNVDATSLVLARFWKHRQLIKICQCCLRTAGMFLKITTQIMAFMCHTYHRVKMAEQGILLKYSYEVWGVDAFKWRGIYFKKKSATGDGRGRCTSPAMITRR
jgi:hypothetical protein